MPESVTGGKIHGRTLESPSFRASGRQSEPKTLVNRGVFNWNAAVAGAEMDHEHGRGVGSEQEMNGGVPGGEAGAGGDGGGEFGSATGKAEELVSVLDRHRQWVASGWEAGKRADLHGRDLHTADFCGALLADADLHRADLHGAALRGADLDGADLHRADLHGADMRGADLHWADLHDADLHGADLRGAMLEEADLHRANLHAADLTHAQLRGADLRGADLRDARGLTRAQVDTATINGATLLSLGLRA
jgi:uncharacterized protein YjbI with pentapeptide repeats